MQLSLYRHALFVILGSTDHHSSMLVSKQHITYPRYTFTSAFVNCRLTTKTILLRFKVHLVATSEVRTKHASCFQFTELNIIHQITYRNRYAKDTT